jgi:general secretion pathway protein A
MYESFYNLSESPFRLTPDPRFYYSSATHKRALTHLRFGFHQREGFVVITGKPGTGKTELMLHLLEGLPKERISYGKIVTSNLDANQTLQQVAAAFHIPAEGVKKGILLKKLEDFFLQQVRENRRLVLIIDEAHKLSINSLNELQMLTNFQLSGKVALQCFLSGHDTLKLKLQDPELLHLKQRVITSTFLTPLEKQETQHYIEHRLRCVGWNEDPKFNLTAYSLIHDVTEGIPRQINALCNRILLRAYAEQKHYIDEGMVSRAIDDVQSEPLAATPTDSPMAPLSPQRQSVGDESENIQAMFERSMQQTSVFKPTHHYYDEDETLPLTSAVNFYPTHSNGNVNLGDDGGVYQGQWANNGSVAASTIAQRSGVMPASLSNKQGSMLDSEQDDTLDDARKFSDALTKFHQQTASAESSKTKESGQSVQPAYRGGGQKNAPFHGWRH